jgi:hypothetical protein
MSHGSKKWIRAFDGRIKRSNDRTKKDYYRGLRWWNEYDSDVRWGRYRSRKYEGEFCPQCKHVAKAFREEADANRAAHDALRARYDAQFGDVEKAWRTYDYAPKDMLVVGADGRHYYKRVMLPPRFPRPPHFYEWAREQDDNIGNWYYDRRSYLCYKHEQWSDKKDEMWRSDYPGKKRHYKWMVKQEWQYYRAEVRNLMQQAKYDDDVYEDIPKLRHGWLD